MNRAVADPAGRRPVAPRQPPPQPEAVEDVLDYLLRAPGVEPDTYDIGLSAPTTFEEMYVVYARERGLQERRVVGLPIGAYDVSAGLVRPGRTD